MSSKKIAFCHDWIYHIGGAEGVFFDLIRKYDKSENFSNIYTLFSDSESIDVDGKSYHIYTALPTWICKIFVYFASHRIMVLSQIFDYRNLMFWYPFLIWVLSRKINNFGSDEVVISNSACIKNIYISNNLTKKILYLHSPLMYIRNHYDDNVAKLWFGIRQFYQFAALYLRPWDLKFRYYDEVFANSKYTAKLCQNIYGFGDMKVLYPKIGLGESQKYLESGFLDVLSVSDVLSTHPYYIYIGRLVRFSKDLDTIIYMFNDLWYELHIIWSGPDDQYLKYIAKDNIKFLGYIWDKELKKKQLSGALWLINLTMESFGIITVEAMMCWLPVFGYDKWWSVELVDHKSGILVNNKTIDNLKTQFEIFAKTKRDRQYIYDKANKLVVNIDKDWK